MENQENALNVAEQEQQTPVESQSTETPPEQPAQEAEQAPSEEQNAAENETENEGELKPWMKERIARANRKAERLRQEADMYKMQLQSYGYQTQFQQQQPAQSQNQQPQGIDPSQLNEETVMSLMEKAEMKRRQQLEFQAKQQAHEAFQRKLSEGADKFEDFDDVVRDPSLPMTPVMVEAVLDISDPDTLLYSLAKEKRQRLSEIARLSPAQQIREMGVLVAEHKANTKPKLVSKAPAPPSTQPKSSAGSAVQKAPDEMTAEEYCTYLREKRKSQIRR